MLVIVTLCWGKAWSKYGAKCIDSWLKHIKEPTKLVLVTDEVRAPRSGGPISQVLLRDSPHLINFGYADHAQALLMGKVPTDSWKDKERALGYSWRYDAMKWAPQLCAPAVALPYCEDGDTLVWLDADVEAFRDVPEGFFDECLIRRWLDGTTNQWDLAYLGRVDGKWSEIGYWSVHVTPETREFVEALGAAYGTGAFYDMGQWHSAYVFDRVREEHAALRQHNLTPTGRGHVWFQSVLGTYLDHMKGDRKNRGGSDERRRMKK